MVFQKKKKQEEKKKKARVGKKKNSVSAEREQRVAEFPKKGGDRKGSAFPATKEEKSIAHTGGAQKKSPLNAEKKKKEKEKSRPYKGRETQVGIPPFSKKNPSQKKEGKGGKNEGRGEKGSTPGKKKKSQSPGSEEKRGFVSQEKKGEAEPGAGHRGKKRASVVLTQGKKKRSHRKKKSKTDSPYEWEERASLRLSLDLKGKKKLIIINLREKKKKKGAARCSATLKKNTLGGRKDAQRKGNKGRSTPFERKKGDFRLPIKKKENTIQKKEKRGTLDIKKGKGRKVTSSPRWGANEATSESAVKKKEEVKCFRPEERGGKKATPLVAEGEGRSDTATR